MLPTLLPSASAVASAVASASDVRAALQHVADTLSESYNMSVSMALHSPDMRFAVASGFTDAGLGMGSPRRAALPDDLYVWGSTTKMYTGAAVLQLVERGVVGLDDGVAEHVDPLLLKLNGTTLASRLPFIGEVRIRHLLHMTSGIADYDSEAYAAAQFSARQKDFSPVEILSSFVSPTPKATPGTRQEYCSTNYILLGLVLARHSSPRLPASWRSYDQRAVLPDATYAHTTFVDRGSCEEATPVHGFMAAYEGASLPPQDVWNVSCVGGWTAGNLVASTADVARFTHALYAPRSPVLSAASQARARPRPLATRSHMATRSHTRTRTHTRTHTRTRTHPLRCSLSLSLRGARLRPPSPPRIILVLAPPPGAAHQLHLPWRAAPPLVQVLRHGHLLPRLGHRRQPDRLRARRRHVRVPEPDHLLPRRRLRARGSD